MRADPREILNLPTPDQDVPADTIGEFLKKLFTKLWDEDETFSGKRPFGNSGWKWDLYVPLVKAGLVEGVLDEEGYLEDVDEDHAERLIRYAIHSLFPVANQ